MDFQIHAVFSMQHQHVHQLVIRPRQTLRRLNLVPYIKYDFHTQGIAEQANTLIYVADQNANLMHTRGFSFSHAVLPLLSYRMVFF